MLPKRHFVAVRLTPKEVRQLTKASKSSEYRTTGACVSGETSGLCVFGLPAEWRYVVTCSNPCEFGYVNAYATSTDDLKFSYS